jgi:hypothetical protein
MIRVGCPRKVASRGPLAELGRTRRRPPLARAFTLKPWQSYLGWPGNEYQLPRASEVQMAGPGSVTNAYKDFDRQNQRLQAQDHGVHNADRINHVQP